MQTYKIDELYELEENNRDQTLIETDTKTVLELKINNTSESSDEISCLNNILTGLNISTQLINNKFTTEQIILLIFDKTDISS